ncbi:translation initiation factor [Halosegnis marinus]|uniref:Protein translation factor SUI1 homolog n=1 Tax=Halosegnis marinus TaxID=3034023 RepID=A0ABD5ZME5_9EURY|nr:translation initiation factor [Halosegnis sp. DT85]
MNDTDGFDEFDPMDDLDRAETTLSIRVESRRYGKPMTVVEGFGDGTDLRALASTLKKRIGTGGTVEDGTIELQGDHRDRLPELLEKEGYAVA